VAADRDRNVMPSSLDRDITVVGAGPTGLATALALASTGAVITVAAPLDIVHQDTRTTAVLGGGIDFLKNIGVWDRCAPHTAPLRGIRIIDDRGGLLRAPEVTFRCKDLGLEQFGANIPNSVLVASLLDVARSQPAIILHTTEAVTAIATTGAGVTCVDAEGRRWRTSLCVGADGRQSRARAAAGISTRTWSYPQTAVVCSFTHSRSHDGVSNEFHRTSGPLTTVPLPPPLSGGFASSLVWVETPEYAAKLVALDTVAFTRVVTDHLHGLLGYIEEITARASFPLNGLNATVMGQNGIALVGEAAHVIPPIGAQGLNLGLRDAATLVDCVADGFTKGHSPGAAEVLSAYHAARTKDVLTRTVAVDALNRSLLLDFFPVQMARSLGLQLAANSLGLKKLAMQQGLGPVGSLPSLMRPRLMQSKAEQQQVKQPVADTSI
jgi:2-octaprenyl-6-methoxyphenol hydroxylase